MSFQPPIPQFQPQSLGVWLAQLEAVMELNGFTIQPFKHSILLDGLRTELHQLFDGPPTSSLPYQDLETSVLQQYGADYHQLPEVDIGISYAPPPLRLDLPTSEPLPAPSVHTQPDILTPNFAFSPITGKLTIPSEGTINNTLTLARHVVSDDPPNADVRLPLPMTQATLPAPTPSSTAAHP